MDYSQGLPEMRHEFYIGVPAELERGPVALLDPINEVGNRGAVRRAEVFELLGVKTISNKVLDVSAEDGSMSSAAEPAGEEVVERDDLGKGEQALLDFFFVAETLGPFHLSSLLPAPSSLPLSISLSSMLLSPIYLFQHLHPLRFDGGVEDGFGVDEPVADE